MFGDSLIVSILVYSSTFQGCSNCKAVYEGNKHLLLNINNRYFIHYGVLFEYSEFMTMSRNTLHGYMRYIFIYLNTEMRFGSWSIPFFLKNMRTFKKLKRFSLLDVMLQNSYSPSFMFNPALCEQNYPNPRPLSSKR